MNRILSALKLDFKLQYRYGFYYAAAFITAVWIAFLYALFRPYLSLALPFAIFIDLGVVGFFFIAGQIIFEKTERTIYALVLTPLSFKEYLISKLITFTAMAWLISHIVVIASYGWGFNSFLLSTGVILTSVLVLLVGVIAVAPYESISSFLVPSQLYFLVLYLPIVDYLGLLKSRFFYLIPTQGSLILLDAAFKGAGSLELWQMLYAVVYLLFWIAALIRLAGIRFERFIVAGQKGGRV